MRLTTGTRLGPYEVLALLGSGGMAEVYRAKDTRLGRDVAIKVVSEALGADSAFLERFEREAKLAGSLNHPNVVALHDIGVHDGKPYFVTELLQGETLRERLAKGPIPLGKALEWAAQMAQGLAAAHERGIVHRDLKPENVFITRDGHVKLLDFGIAKLIEAAQEANPHGLLDETVSPSGSSTGTGMLLGTPGYMSPEQVRADAVDARTDFFSLGAVLYEMLSGRRAFPVGSVVESGYAILHNEPEPLPAAVPASVTQVVSRCLEKDTGRRFQSARDLAFNLDLLRNPTGSDNAPLPSSAPRWRKWWWLVPMMAVIGLVAVAIQFAVPVRRDSVSSVRTLTFREGLVSYSRFGPDSRTVYFSASWHGEPQQVYSTTSDNPDYHALGINEARLQTVSPSGELAVLLHPRGNSVNGGATGTLARVPGVGGVPREIANDVSGADWAPDGANLVITRETPAGSRVEYPIGNPVYDTTHPLGPVRVSPKGGRIAVVEFARPHDWRGDIVVIEPGRPNRVLIKNWEGVYGIAWAAGGNELWFGGLPLGVGQQPSLWAVSLRGEVRLLHASMEGEFIDDIAKDGRALVRGGNRTLDVGVINVAEKTSNAHLGWFDSPVVVALSADGQSMLIGEASTAGVAFGASNGGGAYWTFLQKTDGSPPVRLGPGHALDLSLDGKWALALDETGHPGRLWLLPTGSGTGRSIDVPDLEFTDWWGFFLRDAKGAVLLHQGPEGPRAYVVDFESRRGRALTPPLRCCSGAVSPDRRFLAATSLDGTATMYAIEGGSPRVLSGVGPDDLVVAWIDRGLLVIPDGNARGAFRPPVHIFRVDTETGSRHLFATIGPGDAPGADGIVGGAMTPDGRTAAYSYSKVWTTLFLYDFRADANFPGAGGTPR